MGLRGFILDTAYRPLGGARVEVVDGPSAGTSVVAGDDGQFALNGVFNSETRFRATKDGHESRTQPWNCSVAVCLGPSGAQPWLGFYLSVLEPTADISGSYTLTITADSACASVLPEFARSRSYRATVTAQPVGNRSTIPGFAVELTDLAHIGSLDGFVIGVAGNVLSFWLDGRHDPTIVEDFGSNSYLAYSGTANTTATAGASTITAAFDGWIEYVELRATLHQWYFPLPATITQATCDSGSHRMTLSR
jgi:hypothetical protein